ncbi:MAG: hypothetical protein R2729_25130 [Bryobacteraceae bacterium]
MSTQADFDFLIGSWAISHRRLKHRLAGSTEWEVFDGAATCRKILNGIGNFDENYLELPGGSYHAMSLRTFDSTRKEWSIWWLDGRNPGALDPPVKGYFADGLGTFLADDTFAGKAIKVRFRWDSRDESAPRWEQAFSPDEGVTWETNWIMEFRRLADSST